MLGKLLALIVIAQSAHQADPQSTEVQSSPIISGLPEPVVQGSTEVAVDLPPINTMIMEEVKKIQSNYVLGRDISVFNRQYWHY